MLAHHSKDASWSALEKSPDAERSTYLITDATTSNSPINSSNDRRLAKRLRHSQLWKRYAGVTTLHGVVDAQLATGRCGTCVWLAITAFMTAACSAQLYSLVCIGNWQLKLICHEFLFTFLFLSAC